jgi:hypothetical protein
MSPIRLIIFSTAGATLLGCAETWPHERPAVCPKHQISLQSRILFAPSHGTIVDPPVENVDVMIRIGDRFPYSIPFGFSRGRTETFPVRCQVFYCPVCEQGVQHEYAKTRL